MTQSGIEADPWFCFATTEGHPAHTSVVRNLLHPAIGFDIRLDPADHTLEVIMSGTWDMKITGSDGQAALRWAGCRRTTTTARPFISTGITVNAPAETTGESSRSGASPGTRATSSPRARSTSSTTAEIRRRPTEGFG